jgi:hypothetical protein
MHYFDRLTNGLALVVGEQGKCVNARLSVERSDSQTGSGIHALLS